MAVPAATLEPLRIAHIGHGLPGPPVVQRAGRRERRKLVAVPLQRNLFDAGRREVVLIRVRALVILGIAGAGRDTEPVKEGVCPLSKGSPALVVDDIVVTIAL